MGVVIRCGLIQSVPTDNRSILHSATMRPHLPLALAAILLVPPAFCSVQSPLADTFSTTLVDALSADPNYTSLLRLLQRARLIPTLNRLNGSTFFAPTNDAIKDHHFWFNGLRDEHVTVTDNVQEQLRQQLFYHLLNYSLSSLPTDQNLITYKTLLYPRTPLEPPSQNPPPDPPWMPIPGGSLGGEPQRLRGSMRDENTWVGVDVFGKGGSMVASRTDTGNGVLFGISKVLEPPSNLGTLLVNKMTSRN